jgi:hypothetical protein
MTWTAPNKGKTSAGGIDTAYLGINNNGRQAQGLSVVKEFVNVSAKYTSAHLTPRLGGTAKGTGLAGGPKSNVKQIQSETIGPSFQPKATRPAASPESATTLANTRFILPSVSSKANFYGQ